MTQRTREEIEIQTEPNDELIVEVLLDIRDLLANPPIEISGEQALDEAWDEARDLLADKTKEK